MNVEWFGQLPGYFQILPFGLKSLFCLIFNMKEGGKIKIKMQKNPVFNQN